MANNRVFYACEAVAIGKCGDDAGTNPDQHFPLTPVHGVQSLGFNTSFNIEGIFELGQIAVYENMEGTAEIEMTIEKILDGWPLIFEMATSGARAPDLAARTKRRCNVAVAIGNDDENAISGAPPVEIFMSGMKVNGLTYTFPVDGPFTESVTLTGSQKAWNMITPFDDPVSKLSAGGMVGWNQAVVDKFRPPGFSKWNQDYPIGSGGVQRRENIDMSKSIMPVSVYGVNGTGIGNNWNNSTGTPRAHFQNATISIGSFNNEYIYELGRKEAYYQSFTGQLEVTSEFEVLTVSGDFVNYVTGKPTSPNQPIKLVLTDGSIFDLGGNNKLSAVNYGGGEAGGGNLTITYSFTTSNMLDVTGPSVYDPPKVQL